MEKSNTIVIIYDCPFHKCDKLWLKEELVKKGYRVKPVFSFCRISNVEQRGGPGKLAARLLTLWQCIRGMAKSSGGDTVICWSQWSGLFFNLLPGAGKRYIISYNWLTPVPNEKTRFLYTRALENRRLTAVINSPETRERILSAYQARDTGNIVFIPDVYDDREEFQQPVWSEGERYCFSGGRANRDWPMLMEIAGLCPEIPFRFVAVRSDWDSRLEIPKNVEVFFDLEPEAYYKLLRDSHMSIYPLKEDRVSGLINILRSIQLGKPVLVTGISFTKMYFPKEHQDCLLPFGDSQAWRAAVERVWNCGKEEYESLGRELQEHVKETFSPEGAARRVDGMIREGNRKEG